MSATCTQIDLTVFKLGASRTIEFFGAKSHSRVMSDREKYPSELAERFQVRMPEGMREQLRMAAEENERSMNAEIVQRLERSFFEWPRISLPVEMRSRAMNAPADKRHKAEQEIQAFVFRVAEHFFPKADDALDQFISSFHLVMDHAHYMTEEQRETVWEDFNRLIETLHIETLESE